MHALPLLRAMALLLAANGAPVITKKVLGDRFAWPVDAGTGFVDREPLFGRSKTWRGILASLVATLGAARLVGVGSETAAAVALTAMVGDLCSSFVKRRLARAPSSRATGFDQVPESLLPLLVCRHELSLTLLDAVIGTGVFFAGELVLSRLLYRVHLRDEPY